jgi:hypothetical protein
VHSRGPAAVAPAATSRASGAARRTVARNNPIQLVDPTGFGAEAASSDDAKRQAAMETSRDPLDAFRMLPWQLKQDWDDFRAGLVSIPAGKLTMGTPPSKTSLSSAGTFAQSFGTDSFFSFGVPLGEGHYGELDPNVGGVFSLCRNGSGDRFGLSLPLIKGSIAGAEASASIGANVYFFGSSAGKIEIPVSAKVALESTAPAGSSSSASIRGPSRGPWAGSSSRRSTPRPGRRRRTSSTAYRRRWAAHPVAAACSAASMRGRPG